MALELSRSHHWIAANSYRVRVAAFALVGIPIALHVLPRQPGPLFLALFLLQFFVYPHAMHWFSRARTTGSRPNTTASSPIRSPAAPGPPDLASRSGSASRCFSPPC
ncbi:MAG: hypothetical protein IPH39_15320 [Sulfuritalea sp.]|nr:hypothetical protein [Sulfuritalea sp.]